MLLAPGSIFSLPYPASGPAGRAGGAGALTGQTGDSSSPAQHLAHSRDPLHGSSAHHRTKQQFWGISGSFQQLSISWGCSCSLHGRTKCWVGVKFVPKYFREELAIIGVCTDTGPLWSSRCLGPPQIPWLAQGEPQGRGGTEGTGRATGQAVLPAAPSG